MYFSKILNIHTKVFYIFPNKVAMAILFGNLYFSLHNFIIEIFLVTFLQAR